MPLPTLPPRLREVLALLLQGLSEKQVAHRLKLSPHTIHAYVKSLHKIFGASSRGELLAIAYRMLLADARKVPAARYRSGRGPGWLPHRAIYQPGC